MAATRSAYQPMLLTTQLDVIAQHTGMLPGQVDPQCYEGPYTPHRGELVRGYWLVPHPWPVDYGSRMEWRWELWTLHASPRSTRPVPWGESDLLDAVPPADRVSRMLPEPLVRDLVRLLGLAANGRDA